MTISPTDHAEAGLRAPLARRQAARDAGFKISNPNAVRSCGRGASFEAADASAEPTGNS
jgi:hypothetical protein